MTADPWALLRDARESHCSSWRFRCGLCSRIDAALAERQDSAQNAVEWRPTKDGIDQTCSLPSGEILRVYPIGGVWHYSIAEMRVRAPYGYCATETEAKAAAIAAARGLR